MVMMIIAYIYSVPDTIKSALHGLSHLNPHPDPMKKSIIIPSLLIRKQGFRDVRSLGQSHASKFYSGNSMLPTHLKFVFRNPTPRFSLHK